jgi:hypothetical protein
MATQEHASSTPQNWKLGLGLGGLVGAVALLHIIQYLTPFEDAYITFRYAEHLARGYGIAYNPGERVEGCSSLSWTLLLGLVARCGLPVPASAVLLSVTIGLGSLALAVALAQRCLASWLPGRESSFHARAAFLCGAAVAANGTFAYFAASGMETLLCFCLLLGIIERLTRRPPPGRSWLTAVLLTLLALTHPEGLLYTGGTILLVVLEPDDRARRLRLAGMTALLVSGLWAARWAYFGYFWPNPVYAKAGASLGLWLAGLRRAESYLTLHGFWLALAGLAWVAIRRRRDLLTRLAVLVVGLALAMEIASGGDAFAFYRFLLPAMPFGAAAMVFLAVQLALSRLPVRRSRPLGIGLALLWLGASAGASYLPARSLLYRRSRSDVAVLKRIERINADYFEVGLWLREHLPRDAVLATNAAGIVPYVSERRTIDMLGLNDVHIAHGEQSLGMGVVGHEKRDARYVLSRRPNVILLGLPTLSRARVPEQELSSWVGRGYRLLPGDRELYESAEFRRAYVPLSVPVESRFLLLFVRRTPDMPGFAR